MKQATMAPLVASTSSSSFCSRLRTTGAPACTVTALPRLGTQQAPLIRHSLRQTSGLEAASSSPLANWSQRIVSEPQRECACQAFDPKDPRGGGKAMQLNPAYVAIIGGFALLFLFRNPYIFAAITILTIIPQNSAVTSLNSLVLLFYDSGLFMNFAEAVYCVRLISWVSIACMLISFAIFA